MDKIIDVKQIVADIKETILKRVDYLKSEEIVPKLAVILANDDEASKLYVSKKDQLCKELGVEQITYTYDSNVNQDDILNKIDELNDDDTINAILVQMPLFKHLDAEEIIMAINPDKDVDGFHPNNLGKIVAGYKVTYPATPKGIIKILDSIGETIEGKRAVIVGRSIIVGKPVAHMLMNRGATITICHRKTVDLGDATRKADILVVATGVPKLITESMVKQGAIVIDVGVNRVDGKVVGDVDFDGVLKRAKYITKVPGGVGLTTVVCMVENVVELTERQNNIKSPVLDKK